MIKNKENAVCAADVCYPAETRLFERCVRQYLSERIYLAPFPLFDISGLLYAKGVPPLADRLALSGTDGIKHGALDDVRMNAAICVKYGLFENTDIL